MEESTEQNVEIISCIEDCFDVMMIGDETASPTEVDSMLQSAKSYNDNHFEEDMSTSNASYSSATSPRKLLRPLLKNHAALFSFFNFDDSNLTKKSTHLSYYNEHKS